MNHCHLHATFDGQVIIAYAEPMNREVMTPAQARERAALLLRIADLAEGARAAELN